MGSEQRYEPVGPGLGNATDVSDGSERGSLELASLASSDESGSTRTVSSRGLSSLELPENEDDEGPRRGRRYDRAFSISSLGENMFSLAATIENFGEHVPLEKQKRLSYLHGLGLVVGLQIGSGIFASPNQVNSHAGYVFSRLLTLL
jgi:hypothetical protein